MSGRTEEMRDVWEESFSEQIKRGAYNTAPVEALVRTVAYWLRDRYGGQELRDLHFLDLGCGAGPNMLWLAEKGIRVSGVDISPTALELARKALERGGYDDRVEELVESSVNSLPLLDESYDGILEACVFQHLDAGNRSAAFAEVARLLKPGGVFVGYMLDVGHTLYSEKRSQELEDDPGTLVLDEGGSKFQLDNIGLAHFFREPEFADLLPGFSLVDPCLTTYYVPREEAVRRGYDEYLHSLWTVYAIK